MSAEGTLTHGPPEAFEDEHDIAAPDTADISSSQMSENAVTPSVNPMDYIRDSPSLYNDDAEVVGSDPDQQDNNDTVMPDDDVQEDQEEHGESDSQDIETASYDLAMSDERAAEGIKASQDTLTSADELLHDVHEHGDATADGTTSIEGLVEVVSSKPTSSKTNMTETDMQTDDDEPEPCDGMLMREASSHTDAAGAAFHADQTSSSGQGLSDLSSTRASADHDARTSDAKETKTPATASAVASGDNGQHDDAEQVSKDDAEKHRKTEVEDLDLEYINFQNQQAEDQLDDEVLAFSKEWNLLSAKMSKWIERGQRIADNRAACTLREKLNVVDEFETSFHEEMQKLNNFKIAMNQAWKTLFPI
ncbi:hypothetical protein EMMF5_002576 [Cystobasidiomycetes sp. EMM_F5]